jgi:hypothetical protein
VTGALSAEWRKLRSVRSTFWLLAVTGEYATGTMRSSLAVVPRRGVLFAAKAVTVTAVALLAGEVVVFGMFAVGRLIAGHRTMSFNATAVAPEVPHLLAGGLSVAVLALLGLGLGTVLRSTAGAVVSVVAVLAGWVLAALLPAAVLLRRRDA